MVSAQTDVGIVDGQILSADGSPAANVRVTAMDVDSARTSPVFSSLSVTDSLGNFRLTDVPPGKYYIFIGRIDAPLYFPGVLDRSRAAIISVTKGSTSGPINFKLMGMNVHGVVTHSSADANLKFSDVILTGANTSPIHASIDVNGTFEFINVPRDSYSVAFLMSDRTTAKVSFEVVDHDISVKVEIPRELEVRGRIIVNGGKTLPRFSFLMESKAFGQMTSNANIKPDGTFSAKLPEDIRFTLTGFDPSHYILKSVTYGSVNLLTDPIKQGDAEIVVTFDAVQ